MKFALSLLAVFCFLGSASVASADTTPGDYVCKIGKENPFLKFEGGYKVHSYSRACGGGPCSPMTATSLSFHRSSEKAVRLTITYDTGRAMAVDLPNDSYDDDYYRLEICGTTDMARFYLENKDSMINTRILMIQQFTGWTFLLDDGIYSETLVLSK